MRQTARFLPATDALTSSKSSSSSLSSPQLLRSSGSFPSIILMYRCSKLQDKVSVAPQLLGVPFVLHVDDNDHHNEQRDDEGGDEEEKTNIARSRASFRSLDALVHECRAVSETEV